MAKTIDIFEGLLKKATRDGEEHIVDESQDFFDCEDDSEVEEAEKKLRATYDSLVSEVTAAWGKPDFSGETGTKGFPKWADIEIHLTYWKRGKVTAYVALRHEDKELPFDVCLGARS